MRGYVDFFQKLTIKHIGPYTFSFIYIYIYILQIQRLIFEKVGWKKNMKMMSKLYN